MPEQLIYQIGISLIKGIGPKLARNLIAYVGDEKEVFKQSVSALSKIPGIGHSLALAIKSADVLERAQEELHFIHKHQINSLFFTDDKYPQRLNYCDDAPLMLFVKGNDNLNHHKMVGIVGTRKASENAKINCENLVKGLALRHPGLSVVSGLAYGIDVCAHRAALVNGLSTYGVLAHGLDRIYPGVHRETAAQMINEGGLITEFVTQTNPDKPNFVKRNRIVAGLCDALVVVESSIKGGAVITARMAHSYNRDVLAFPGEVQHELAGGCNYLIKKNIAALIENAEDLDEALGWESEGNNKEVQRQLFIEFQNKEEEQLYQLLQLRKELTASEMSVEAALPVSRVSATMLSLEFAGLVKCLPGNAFSLGLGFGDGGMLDVWVDDLGMLDLRCAIRNVRYKMENKWSEAVILKDIFNGFRKESINSV